MTSCCQLPRCCRLLRRIVMHNIKKASWYAISSDVISFIVLPFFLITSAVVYEYTYLRVVAGIYSFVALLAATHMFFIPVKRALAEAKERQSADRSRIDIEASETVPMDQVIEPVQRSTLFWTEALRNYPYPHWLPSSPAATPSSESDTLKKIRLHNERLGAKPGSHSDVAETSFIRNVESSEVEGNLQVTHRSLHPTRTPEEESNPSSQIVTEAEVYRPNTGGMEKVHEI
ncbi:uncharacterized protein [Parasteatoda tepidariorum]|uniref:uncharacterized protein n=1 Tax=Parasteatoda tepidariorum TaxID=114398 RepID=UPI001C722770|nr:uncharacterized protein LOC122272275 [Parasteatoda tepidariorum]